MPLNFGGIAGTYIARILVDRQWRKFGPPDTHHANRKMRGQVNAPQKKESPEDKVGRDSENS